MNTKWGRAIYLFLWREVHSAGISHLWDGGLTWWLNCVCVGRVLLSKLKLYKQLDIPDGGHIRGCLVWRVTRKCDSRFWGRMWPNLWSPVACLSSPPSTLGSGCYELNKYLLFLYFRYVGAAMCDSRLASVKESVTQPLISVLSFPCPSPAHAPHSPSPARCCLCYRQ